MCSICGIVDFENRNNIDISLLGKMGGSMKHRGPDQTNMYVTDSVGLHHNRLSVIDPENGIQPMTIVHDRNIYTIVYNGEIYNAPELRRELESRGAVFKTHCDTEVVLYSYIIFGDRCAEKLNGIFSFCIYDEQCEQLFIARDRFGVKPLFYCLFGSCFLFASEIKALLRHPFVSPAVDMRGMWQLLYMSPVTINGSGIFRDIREIKPGYCGFFTRDGLWLRRYWQLKATEFTDSRNDALEKVEFLLTDAIHRQLVSDVPLCTFLSGGLDSSLISSVAADEYKKHGDRLSTYSFEYEGNKQNFKSSLFQPQGDDEYATYLADYLGTNHTVLTAPTEAVADCLRDAVLARDFPGQADIDSSLLYFCRLVKKNHTVAVSGECADEIFGGYPWFYRPEMLSRGFFPWIHDPFVRINLFNDKLVHSREGYDYISAVYQNDIKECPTLDSDSKAMRTSRIATHLSVNYFMTSLLERKDRMSMASGVEVRVPFADHRILEYVYNIPWEIKFENNTEKALLRNAMANWLPDKILHRKKSPYPKTHNPEYEVLVHSLLSEQLNRPGSALNTLLDADKVERFMQSDDETWFGQLMSKPQLMAWLLQLGYWFEEYGVNLKI